MNMKLIRKTFGLYGIVGELQDDTGKLFCYTLEHAYPSLNRHPFQPKVAAGVYVCGRHPPNRLPYETFELANVPPFQGAEVTGILIHVGNYNKDSEGCILLGLSLGAGCITDSKLAFDKLMEAQSGVETFTLTVI